MTYEEAASAIRADLVPRMRLVCASMPECEFQELIDDMMRIQFDESRRRMLDDPWGRIPTPRHP